MYGARPSTTKDEAMYGARLTTYGARPTTTKDEAECMEQDQTRMEQDQPPQRMKQNVWSKTNHHKG